MEGADFVQGSINLTRVKLYKLLLSTTGQHLVFAPLFLLSCFCFFFGAPPSAHIVHGSDKNLSGVLTQILVFPSYVVPSYLKISPLLYSHSLSFELCISSTHSTDWPGEYFQVASHINVKSIQELFIFEV